MLVPFVVDADSLTPDPGWTSAQVRACHHNFLSAWQRIGLLTFDGDSLDRSRLRAAVANLPQSVRPLWQEILERLPLACCGNGWNGTVARQSIQEIAGISRVAFVDDARAEVEFDFSEERDELPILHGEHNVDVCRLLAASSATAFQVALGTSGTHIEVGVTFTDIWATRFKTLATAPIKRVAVVDRYAMSSHHEPSPQTGLSGIERFLRLLDSHATGPRDVSVYSAWTAELFDKTIEDMAADINLILRRLTNRRIRRVTLHMAPNTAFRDDGHDRFVRFGEYVWDLGLGLDIFEGAYAQRRSAATLKTGKVVSGYKQIEVDLATNPITRMTEVA